MKKAQLGRLITLIKEVEAAGVSPERIEEALRQLNSKEEPPLAPQVHHTSSNMLVGYGYDTRFGFVRVG